MRAYACGQCHVEYYFMGAEKRLRYPWDQGLRADEILAYYEQTVSKTGSMAKPVRPR
jgi:nitrite reductase (cytochrome c-552)